MMYSIVQVKYDDSMRLYSYLAPVEWRVRVGDKVRHDGAYGGWATVERVGPGSWNGPFRVLTEKKPRDLTVTFTAPREQIEELERSLRAGQWPSDSLYGRIAAALHRALTP